MILRNTICHYHYTIMRTPIILGMNVDCGYYNHITGDTCSGAIMINYIGCYPFNPTVGEFIPPMNISPLHTPTFATIDISPLLANKSDNNDR